MEDLTLDDDELLRLDVLHRYGILDTPSDEAIDDIVRLCGKVCEAPMAMVSLIDRDRQWFKSHLGIMAAETPLEHSFCQHTIRQRGVFVVNDTWEDSRFSSNPFVIGPPWVRFYAGVPLITAEGYALGTLCVLDTVSRILLETQCDALTLLSRQIVAKIEETRGSEL